MGRRNRKNKTTLKYEINKEFSKRIKFGEKKPKFEKDEIDINIYSKKTFKTYKNECIHFTNYCFEKYKSKNLKECKIHVEDYLKKKQEEGYSAFSIRTYANAIAKLYKCKSTDFNINYEKRHFKDIKNNRGEEVIYKKRLDFDQNKDLIKFISMCGLRRNEIEHLKLEDLHISKRFFEAKSYIMHGYAYLNLDGKFCKHGKKRKVELLVKNNDDIDFFYDFLKNRCLKNHEGYFGKIPGSLRVHNIRSDYAINLYKKYEGNLQKVENSQKYFCRNEKKGMVFDKEAVQIVSSNLGHNRLDVVINNYIHKGFKTL